VQLGHAKIGLVRSQHRTPCVKAAWNSQQGLLSSSSTRMWLRDLRPVRMPHPNRPLMVMTAMQVSANPLVRTLS
jgi:hypothetical protein